MKHYIAERVEQCALYILENKTTIRAASKKFNVAKSTTHVDMKKRLLEVRPDLVQAISEIAQFNTSERHLRGGDSTKRLYSKKKDD